MPGSDELVTDAGHSNDVHNCPPSLEDNVLYLQDPTFLRASASESESFSKVLDDARPLLERNRSLSGVEGDGYQYLNTDAVKSVDANAEGASVRSAVFNLSTTVIGAGIMALPATMRVLGVLPGLVMILVMGLLSEASLEIVVRYTGQTKSRTFGGMVHAAWGRTGQLVAQMAIIINNGGILIVYVIIMGDVLSGSKDHTGTFESWVGRKGWWTNRSVVQLLIMVLVLGPLVSLKRIDSLEISSAISVVLALLFVVLLSGIALVELLRGKLGTPRLLPTFGSRKEVLDLLTVIPVMSNAFVCQFNVPPIYAELKDRTTPAMNRVGRISLGFCVAVYVSTALSGYLLFGDVTESDVLSNFDGDLGISHGEFFNDIIRLGYVVHLFFVFPVVHFAFREAVYSLLFPGIPMNNQRFALLTIVLLTIIYAGSALVPNIWVAFKFTGTTTGLSLGFMFPAIVAIKMKGGNKMEQKLSWGILLLSVVVSSVGVAAQIISYAEG